MPLPKPVQDILQATGISSEDIAKIEAIPEAEQPTFDSKPFVEKVKANYQTQFKNDPEFFNSITIENLPPAVKKMLESGQYARATNEAKGKFAKALGFSTEEVKDLETDDYKALDYYIPAIAEKWTKTKAGSKELQEQLIEARKKAEQFDGYEEKMRTKYDTEYNQKYTSAVLNAALLGELASIPGLKINAADIAKTAHELLSSKYAFERVGDYSVELRQKGNPQMKVLKNGSSQEMTLKDALNEIAVERGWVEKEQDKKQVVKGTVTPDKSTGLNLVIPPHLQGKISNKIAAEK